MSMNHLVDAWSAPSVKGSHLIVLLALADASDGLGQCRMSAAQLAKKARLTSDQTARIVEELVQAGLLSVACVPGAPLCTYQLLNLNPGQSAEGGPA